MWGGTERMKCSLCQEISDRLKELDALHGEEFVKHFEKTLPKPCEPDKTIVNMAEGLALPKHRKELLTYKKAYYESGWLDAIEEVMGMFARFKITEQTLNNFKSEGIFEGRYFISSDLRNNTILQKLQSLKDNEVRGEDNFIGVIKQTIGEKHTKLFKSLILKYSRILEENAAGFTQNTAIYVIK